MADTDRQRQRGEEYLENGIKEQQITDELLADADAARDMARKAVAKAEGILLEAKETLRTLQGLHLISDVINFIHFPSHSRLQWICLIYRKILSIMRAGV